MNIFKRIWLLYYDGFRSMTVGKKLWIIILVKLFVLFVIMKLIFFPNLLNTKFKTDRERSDHVREQLLRK